MGCGESCQGKFDITDNLEQSGQWQTLNINLSCFAEQGVDLAQVFSHWQLSTQGDWHVSIAKLAITANAVEQSSVTCK